MKKGLILIFLFFNHLAFSSHIVGGELTYKYKSKAGNGDVTYSVKLTVYMDCINGTAAIAADGPAFINVYNAKTQKIINSLGKTVTRQSPVRVSANAYKCIKNKPDVCVDMYVYEVDITLPKLADGYIITYERCCRNSVVVNITSANTGATYWTEIKPESVIGKNSSPVFKARPPVFLCLNAPFTFDHSATDEDGDSLAYELTSPFIGGSTGNNRPSYTGGGGTGSPTFPLLGNRLVKWVSPYNLADQMGGNPILEIDELTGRLTITPDQSGQFVVGIKVKEFRKGVLIGETRRDYQFNVANCVFDVISVFSTAKTNCTNSNLSFTNQSSGALRYHWDFGVTGINSDTSNKTSPTYSYSKPGTYKVTLIAINTVCIDTFDYIITIKENLKVNLGKDTIFCKSASLKLDAGNVGSQFGWNSGQTTQTITVTQTGTYIVTVQNNPCVAKDTILVIIDQSGFNAGKDTVFCNASFIPLTYRVPNIYKSYLWNDNTTSNTVNINKPGKYWVTITNQNNCQRTDTIEVFHFTPPKGYLRDTAVCIGFSGVFDAKILNYSYLWNTGETTRQISTSFTGLQKVTITNGLCSSSDSAVLSNINPGLEIGNDTSFCGPFGFAIKTNKTFVSYNWNNGAYSRETIINNPGKVKVTIESVEGCFQSDSLFIINYPENIASIAGDTAACTSSILDLTATDSNTYVWNTGETTQTIKVQEGGIYEVILTDKNGCMDTVYHRITKNPNALPNVIYMPNVFTPNGDKLNDQYPDNKFQDVHAYYHLMIFNRWGEKLFETQSPGKNWDGFVSGKLCQSDVYIYTLNYLGCDNQRHVINGEFNLMR